MGAAGRTEADVLRVLDAVKDPEIPTMSIVAMGMVEKVTVDADRVDVELVATFVGCPALEIIRRRAADAVSAAFGLSPEAVSVRFGTAVPWSSDRIAKGSYGCLRELGIAPPPRAAGKVLDAEDAVACPYCGSLETTLENVFGPAACRSIYYCHSCRNPFEAMKPV